MIIGVSGKISSGKDLTGKIIQYLTCVNEKKDSHWSKEAYFGNNISATKWLSNNSNWQIKKFADKLKDTVCLLVGCTREQLEDGEFKEKELGEEWWYYKYKNNLEAYNSTEDFPYELSELIKLTPRKLLQLLGTEVGRDIIHPQIWVNALMSEYKISDLGKAKLRRVNNTAASICSLEGGYSPNFIITDIRFENELKAVKDRSGITIRVNRPKERQMFLMNANIVIDTRKTEHESETALDNAEFDYTIDNNGTIEELIEKVREILIKEGII